MCSDSHFGCRACRLVGVWNEAHHAQQHRQEPPPRRAEAVRPSMSGCDRYRRKAMHGEFGRDRRDRLSPVQRPPPASRTGAVLSGVALVALSSAYRTLKQGLLSRPRCCGGGQTRACGQLRGGQTLGLGRLLRRSFGKQWPPPDHPCRWQKTETPRCPRTAEARWPWMIAPQKSEPPAEATASGSVTQEMKIKQ